MVSVTGCNLLQGFRESLLPAVPTSPDEDDDEDIASLMQRLPPDTRPFKEFFTAGQCCCLLLLMLKQHLKDQCGLTDAKITKYSLSEGAKIYKKERTEESSYHIYE